MLQEKIYTYGSTGSKSSRYYRTELQLRELSVSTEDNTSLMEYALVLYTGDRRLSQWRTGAKIWLGGVLYAHRDGTDYDNQISIEENSQLTLMAGTFTIPHSEDGTAKLSVEFSVYHPTTATYTPGNFTYTGGEITLTSIERATTVGATDAYIGGTSMIYLSRKKNTYTHALSYSFGELRGYLGADGGLRQTEERFSASTVAFPLPEAFYSQIPGAKSGSCTLTCYTYDGEMQVGLPQSAAFTAMTRAEDCAPVLSATVEDVNPKTLALTGDKNILVRYMSDARCAATAQGKFGAEIVKITADGVAIGESLTLCGAEKDTYTFRAVDSRGYETSLTVKTGFVPYFHPTANVTASRADPTSGKVAVTVKGIYFGDSLGAEGNPLTVSCLLPDGKTAALTPVLSDGRYSASGILEGFDYTRSHLITATAEDALSAATATATVQKGVPVFHWREELFCTNVPTCLCGVYVQRAQTSGGVLRVRMGESLLLAGGGVLGTVGSSAPYWQGTQGVSAALGEDGEIVLTLPAEISGVMLFSTEAFTVL